MAIEYTPEEIAKIFADQEKYNNASQLYYPIAIWLEVRSLLLSLRAVTERRNIIRRVSFMVSPSLRHCTAADGLTSIKLGLYTMLFVAKCRIMLKKRAVETFASRVFLFSGILIYLLTTIQVGELLLCNAFYRSLTLVHLFKVCACYRLVRGYALLVTPPKGYAYFIEYTRWDNFSHLVILALVTWIGDALVVSRTTLAA